MNGYTHDLEKVLENLKKNAAVCLAYEFDRMEKKYQDMCKIKPIEQENENQNEFFCDCCFKFFPNEEKLEEKQKIFGDMDLKNMATVCDDCFKEIMAFNNHAIKENYESK